MDPLTQGVVGAAVSQQPANKKTILVATLLGFLSGLAPDLDIFIRSKHDPLLVLEFHRQFTHSLIFIPIGGLICAVVFYYLFSKRKGMTFKKTYIFTTLGYGTHGLLDSCTSYGTQLLWPFSDNRISWNTISIVDPLFTMPILVLIIFAAVKAAPAITCPAGISPATAEAAISFSNPSKELFVPAAVSPCQIQNSVFCATSAAT